MFSFQTLWTPRVILIIYIIGLILIVLGGISLAYWQIRMGDTGGGQFGMQTPGMPMAGGGGPVAAVWTLVITAISVVLWRVWCEIVLVLFKVHDRLVEVRDALKH